MFTSPDPSPTNCPAVNIPVTLTPPSTYKETSVDDVPTVAIPRVVKPEILAFPIIVNALGEFVVPIPTFDVV
jgi:hypothetical protein